MTSQKYSTIRKYLFFISIIILFSGCDIVNSVIGGGSTEPNNTEAIDRIEIEFKIDNAKAVLTYKNPPPNTNEQDILTGKEFGADITSIAGTSVYRDESKEYFTNFDNPGVLGQVITGFMRINFFDDIHKVNIHISQGRSHTSSIFGRVDQWYALKYDGIPYNKSYIDSFTDLEVDEYYISKPSVNSTTTYFTEDNKFYFDKTEPTVCGNRAFIKVKVHFK